MTPRLLYRAGMVVSAPAARGAGPPGTVEVLMDAGCAGCVVGCGARTPRIVPVAAESGFRPGDRVRVGVSARSLDRQCAAAFGPWLGVVVALIALPPVGNGAALLALVVAGIVSALALGARLLAVDAHALRPRVDLDGRVEIDEGLRPRARAEDERFDS